MTDDAKWDSQFKTKERNQAEAFSKLFGEVKAAQPSWKKDGVSIVPSRPNTSGISQVPPAQDPLPKPDSPPGNAVPDGVVVPRIYRQDDDEATFVTEVVFVNGALYTEDVLAKNLTPL